MRTAPSAFAVSAVPFLFAAVAGGLAGCKSASKPAAVGGGGASGQQMASVDCAALCAHVGQLCAGRSDIDALWLDACRTACGDRLDLEPDVATLEMTCVTASGDCDTAVTCVATPTAPVVEPSSPTDGGGDGADAAADRQDAASTGTDGGGAPDAAPDAVADAPTGPGAIMATVDGTPIVFDHMERTNYLGGYIDLRAATADGGQTMEIATSSGSFFEAPATFDCSDADIVTLTYTRVDGGAIDTWSVNATLGEPCMVHYTRGDTVRFVGTFSGKLPGPSTLVTVTNGTFDIAYQ